jgi:hypothetical protein
MVGQILPLALFALAVSASPFSHQVESFGHVPERYVFVGGHKGGLSRFAGKLGGGKHSHGLGRGLGGGLGGGKFGGKFGGLRRLRGGKLGGGGGGGGKHSHGLGRGLGGGLGGLGGSAGGLGGFFASKGENFSVQTIRMLYNN